MKYIGWDIRLFISENWHWTVLVLLTFNCCRFPQTLYTSISFHFTLACSHVLCGKLSHPYLCFPFFQTDRLQALFHIESVIGELLIRVPRICDPEDGLMNWLRAG